MIRSPFPGRLPGKMIVRKNLGILGSGWFVTAAGAWVLAACSASQPPPAESASSGSSAVLLGNEPKIEALPAMEVEKPKGKPAPNANPFAGAEFYVNPNYVKSIESTPTTDPADKKLLEKMKKFPTGLWIDRIAAIENVPVWLEGAEKQAKAKGKPVVPVIVVYDLPNRDCAAAASAGELTVEDGGEQRYRTEFIDPIAEHFAKHPDLKIAVVLEPDSLANLATNLGIEQCAKSQKIYKNSTAYAISKLSLPNVYIYLDAAHAGWLGWNSNRNRVTDVYVEVLEMAGGADRIRGFATNVSNYNALEGEWGKKLESSSPTPNELSYVEALAGTLAEKGIKDKGFLVDTSRNGVQESRTVWGNWCNIKLAGLGPRPQVAPQPLVDAYFWVKPPGESDGTSDTSAARFDKNCRSADAIVEAPEAGQWFPEHLLMMMKAANPPL